MQVIRCRSEDHEVTESGSEEVEEEEPKVVEPKIILPYVPGEYGGTDPSVLVEPFSTL